MKLASLDALDAVRARTGRVCPLDCERGFRADGDRCVKITCDSDQVLGPNGTLPPASGACAKSCDASGADGRPQRQGPGQVFCLQRQAGLRIAPARAVQARAVLFWRSPAQ